MKIKDAQASSPKPQDCRVRPDLAAGTIATDRFELLIRSGKLWTPAGRFPTRRRARIEARRILGHRFPHDFLSRFIVEDRQREAV